MAGLLGRALPANGVLESEPQSAGAEGRYRPPATRVVGCVYPPPRFSGGLEAFTGIHLTDHDHGGPLDQGNFLRNGTPQKMLVERPG